MPRLVLLRHGETTYNVSDTFAGWADPPLTTNGESEAVRAATALSGPGLHPDAAFCSDLLRAVRTCEIVLRTLELHVQPLVASQLRERHYGALQGLTREAAGRRLGAERLALTRRSFDQRPPQGESLADVRRRLIPFWLAEVEPVLRAGATTLVVAHGNTLRVLIAHLEQVTSGSLAHIDVPLATPLVYTLTPSLDAVEDRVRLDPV
jgi:2,3-bisphosphoglycerate-dependent phosphoglycerate mutase